MNGFESVFAVRIMNNTRYLVVSSILSLVILMVGTADDTVIAVGEHENLQKLEKELNP